MPTRHPFYDYNKRRDATSARQLREDAAPSGVFRCDRCDRVLPDNLRVEQDGHDYCRTLCADETSVTEITTQLAEQMSATDSMTPNDDPVGSAFDGAVTITSITTTTPFPVTVRSTSTTSIGMGGVNIPPDIAISYGSGSIYNYGAPIITSTSISLRLRKLGSEAGYFDLTVGDYVYRNALLLV